MSPTQQPIGIVLSVHPLGHGLVVVLMPPEGGGLAVRIGDLISWSGGRAPAIGMKFWTDKPTWDLLLPLGVSWPALGEMLFRTTGPPGRSGPTVFGVHSAARLDASSLRVVGRCYRGPIKLGMRFEVATSPDQDQVLAVDLVVGRVVAYLRDLPELDEGLTGELLLVADTPTTVLPAWVLSTGDAPWK